jgi:hypothetical protein
MEPSSRKIRSGECHARLIHVLVPQTPPRLWEPGYRERYYQQKFAVEYSDQEFKKKYDIFICDHRRHVHITSLQNHNPLRRGFSLGARVLLPRRTVISPPLLLHCY